MKKSEYDIQAEQFAQNCKLTMHAVYSGHRARFCNRITAVYHVTLSRPNKEPYCFDFSTSLQDSWVYQDRTTRKLHKGLPRTLNLESMFDHLIGVESTNLNGYYIKRTKKAPSLYDVLACLCSDEPMFFEEWCSCYDYNTDSIEAHKLYLATQKESAAVTQLFADCLEELQEIR